MATISELNNFSELSQASYADLQSGMFSPSETNPDITYIKLLEKEGMAPNQATSFSTRYRVLATSAEYNIGSASGFSATLFEDTETNRKIFAIRGTDQIPGADWDDDIGFGLAAGLNPPQFEDMVAFFELLKNETDPEVRIDIGEKITVTGHSLGGALAQIFTATYSEYVDQTFTYNSPGAKELTSPELTMYDGRYYKDAFVGYDEITGNPTYVQEEITQELYEAYTRFEANKTTVDSFVTNTKASETWWDIPHDLIADLGTDIGSADINISISDSTFNPIHYHSISTLVESLHVYNLFSTISGSNNVDDFTPFLEHMSDEHALAVVNTIFQAGVDTNQEVVDLSMNLTEYVNNHGLTGLTVTSLHNQSAPDLQSAAASDNAILFALRELSGFTISGNQPGYADLDAADYSDHYLEDRAAFLYQIMHPDAASPTPDDMQFYDTALGIDAYAGNGTPDFSDRHYIFGNLEGELIEGNSKEDHLYGMDGDDTLTGNGGDDTDTIQGGDQDDTIRVNSLSLADNSIEIIDGGGGINAIAGTDQGDTIDLTGIQVSHINRIEGRNICITG